MPFVEGETLRDRLDRVRQLPIDEAVQIAGKVAAALEYAHEQGVLHRDIKPANILMSRGEPLVADFGIALALSEAGGGRITQTGLSLGTPHYMSPEQATGERRLDARSDVYALGCVLYEMLAGESPFAGATMQAVLARVVGSEARRVRESRHTVPAHVDGVVARSLEKLPADRFESAKAFADALGNPSFRYGREGPSRSAGVGPASAAAGDVETAPRWLPDRRSLVSATALGLALVMIIAVIVSSGRPPLPGAAAGVLPAHRFVLAEPGQFLTDGEVAIAADGTVAFTEGTGSETPPLFYQGQEQRILVRFPGELRARPLTGTEGGRAPTFSPDGDWIAFTKGRELLKVPVRGGPVVALARTETPPFIHPYWGPGGFIAVALIDGLYQVPEGGGIPVKVHDATMAWEARTPTILPSNAGWIFAQAFRSTAPGSRLDLVLLDPVSGETTVLVEGGTSPVWLATGHIAFVHTSGSLHVGRFDLRRKALVAPPMPVMDSVSYGAFTRTFAASTSGAALYLTGAGLDSGAGAEIVFLGISGASDRLPPLPRTDRPDGRFSPNGEKLAYTRDDQIWIFDIELGTHQRLTTEGANHREPVWTPDGTSVAFASDRGSTSADIWIREVDGDGPARLLLEMEGTQFPGAWTDDGLLVIQTNHGGSRDIYTMPADGSVSPLPYLHADWDEYLPRVSPDGRWLAYVSDQHTESAVLVRSFPQPGGMFMVSEPGISATEPVWSPDGSTVYYRQLPSDEIVAVQVGTSPDFEVVDRRTVGQAAGPLRDAHAGGEWLLAFPWGIAANRHANIRLIGVVNWFSELAERLGER
jgi:eukaryotic-like serine/threonine-protein kinase